MGLLFRFDRYSAEMRRIYDQYRKIVNANPAMEEMEVQVVDVVREEQLMLQDLLFREILQTEPRSSL